MNKEPQPAERLKRLESGIREVLTGMSESRQAFGSTEIKTERRALNACLKHYDLAISAEERIALLLEKLWGTAIVLHAVLKQRKSQKLFIAKEWTEALLKEFIGADGFDKHIQGGDGVIVNDEIEKLFQAMSGKSSDDMKNRPV